MDHRLKKIKRLVLDRAVKFTLKAELEREESQLTRRDVYESILSADRIEKVLNSKNPYRQKREKLYIIKGVTYDDVLVYTKGKIEEDRLYILISSKEAL